jgi:hypothetical protein
MNSRIPAGRVANPGRRVPGGWWRQFDAGLDGEAHERANELIGWQCRELVVLVPERLLCGAEVPVAGSGGLQERQTLKP